MPYRTPQTWSFDLEKAGCPEFRVECLASEDVSAGLQLKQMKAAAILNRLQRRQELNLEDEWALTATDDFLKEVIVSWNLTHPKTNEPLDLKADDPFEPLPSYIYREIVDQVMTHYTRQQGAGN